MERKYFKIITNNPKICWITYYNITFSAVFIWNILNLDNAFGDLHKRKE